MISRFRSELYEVFTLLCFYAAYSGNYLPTCQDTLSVPSSGVKKSVIYRHLKVEPIVCTETAGRNYHYTLRSNPGEPRSELNVLVYRSFANCIRHPTECRMITNGDSRKMWPESVVGCFQLQSQYSWQAETKHGNCLRDYEPLSPKYEAKVPVPTVRPSVSIPESLKRRIVDWTFVIRFRCSLDQLVPTHSVWWLQPRDGCPDCVTPTQPPIRYLPVTLSHGENGRGVNLTAHHCLVGRLRMSRAILPLSHTFSCICAELLVGDKLPLYHCSERLWDPPNILDNVFRGPISSKRKAT